MPISKNIKYCRQKANMTQQELADALGFTKTTVLSWEKKKTAVPVPSAKIIASYFGIDFTEFCDVDIERRDNELKEDRLALTESEIKSILMFRQLPPNIRKVIRLAIWEEYENTTKRNNGTSM